MFSAVWLSWKSFSGISFPVFGWSKHFTEIVGRSSGSSIGVDRSDVRGSERCAWVGARWFVDRSGSAIWILGRSAFSLVRFTNWVPGSELTVIGSDWVGALVAWIGARYLLRCVAVRGSTLCCCVCVGFLFRFSLLSVLLCVEM